MKNCKVVIESEYQKNIKVKEKIDHTNNKNQSSDSATDTLDSSISIEQGALGCGKESIESDNKDLEIKNKSIKSLNIKDFYKLRLRKYLNEDFNIGYAQASNRLRQETGLEVSVSTARKVLKHMREEVDPNHVELPSYFSEAEFESKGKNTRSKLNDSHIECLKKYLIEDFSIGNTEARNRLQEEMGICVSVPTIRRALIKLEKEINPEGTEVSPSGSALKVRNRKKPLGFRLNELHKECLKKYLNENSSIGSTEARNRLQKETGIEVSVTTIWKTIYELKGEINGVCIELPLSTSKSNKEDVIKTKTKPAKLNDLHMECLKKYLREDIFIGHTAAMSRLQKEMDMKVSLFPIRNAMIKLRKEIVQGEFELSSGEQDSNARKEYWDYGYKIKYPHIECLKKYLLENMSIGGTEAMCKLHDETGLKVSISSISEALSKLRKKMNSEHAAQPSPKSKSKIEVKQSISVKS